MYASSRFWMNRTLLCLVYFLSFYFVHTSEAFAQSNNKPDFNYEMDQFLNSSPFSRSVDSATLWGSAGSAWVLEADDNIPEDVARYFHRFEWKGAKIFFNTEFCSDFNETLRPVRLKGHIDFSQNNRYGGNIMPQGVILSTDSGSVSSLKENCTLLTEISDYLNGRVMFKADDRRGEEKVTIDVYNWATGKISLRLVYKPDDTFEPLARTLWKIRPDNDAPTCRLLGFSMGGSGSISCCNYLGFDVKKTDEGWSPIGGYEQTLRACLGSQSNADGLIQRALSKGLKVNEDGNLIAGADSDTPYIFDPVTGLEKAEGVWKLSGLEYRSFDSRIFTMPHVNKVHDEAAIRELNVVLTVKPNELEIQAGCNFINQKIEKIKRGFIRMKTEVVHLSDYCDPKEKVSGILTYKLLSIIGGPTLKVNFDEHEQTLTLTRASIGANGRSHSWIFSK